MKCVIKSLFGLLLAACLASGCGLLGQGDTSDQSGPWPFGGQDNQETQSALPGFRASAPPAREEGGLAPYRLRAGDPLIINLDLFPKYRRIEQVIGEDGDISLEFLGPIEAAGKTASQLETSIRDAYLNNKIYKYVTVNVMVPAREYYLRGEVRRPGVYTLRRGQTVLQAIASAGGYTDYANPRRVNIIRGNGEPFYVNLKEIERSPEKDVNLEPGDIVVVPRSVF